MSGRLHFRVRRKQRKAISYWQDFRWLEKPRLGWGNKSISKYLFCKHEGQSSIYKAPHKRTGLVGCACGLTAGEAETGDSVS